MWPSTSIVKRLAAGRGGKLGARSFVATQGEAQQRDALELLKSHLGDALDLKTYLSTGAVVVEAKRWQASVADRTQRI